MKLILFLVGVLVLATALMVYALVDTAHHERLQSERRFACIERGGIPIDVAPSFWGHGDVRCVFAER